MKKINCTERVTNEDVLTQVKETRFILNTTRGEFLNAGDFLHAMNELSELSNTTRQ